MRESTRTPSTSGPSGVHIQNFKPLIVTLAQIVTSIDTLVVKLEVVTKESHQSKRD